MSDTPEPTQAELDEQLEFIASLKAKYGIGDRVHMVPVVEVENLEEMFDRPALKNDDG